MIKPLRAYLSETIWQWELIQGEGLLNLEVLKSARDYISYHFSI